MTRNGISATCQKAEAEEAADQVGSFARSVLKRRRALSELSGRRVLTSTPSEDRLMSRSRSLRLGRLHISRTRHHQKIAQLLAHRLATTHNYRETPRKPCVAIANPAHIVRGLSSRGASGDTISSGRWLLMLRALNIACPTGFSGRGAPDGITQGSQTRSVQLLDHLEVVLFLRNRNVPLSGGNEPPINLHRPPCVRLIDQNRRSRL